MAHRVIPCDCGRQIKALGWASHAKACAHAQDAQALFLAGLGASPTAPPADDGVDYDWAAPADLSPVDEVGAAQHRTQRELGIIAQHLTAALDALVKDHRPQDMVEAILWCQDQRKVLRDLEERITEYAATAPSIGQSGDLSDGRHYEVKRAAKRTAWDHDAWKRAARAKVTETTRERFVPTVQDALVDGVTGEPVTVGHVVQTAMTALQEFHGSTAPRVGTMRQYDLDPGDYCETSPGGWTVTITDPIPTTPAN